MVAVETAFEIGLALFVLAGVALSLNSIKVESIDPKQDQLGDQLERFSGKSLTISGDTAEFRRPRIIKQAAVFNMLAAADCRVLGYAHSMTELKNRTTQWVDGDKDEKMNINPDDVAEETGTSSDFIINNLRSHSFTDYMLTHEENDDKRIYSSDPQVKNFRALISTDLNTACVGAPNARKAVTDQLDQRFGGILRSAGTAGGAAAGGILLAAGPGGWAVAGAGITAGAVGGYILSDNFLGGSGNDFVKEPGFDMEGKFGAIDLNITRETRSFTVSATEDPNFDCDSDISVDMDEYKKGCKTLFEDSVIPQPLFAANLLPGNEKGKTPPFWRGDRGTFMLPPGIGPDTRSEWDKGEKTLRGKSKSTGDDRGVETLVGDKLHPKEYLDVNAGASGNPPFDFTHFYHWPVRALYSYRIRMKNVPMAFTPDEAEELRDLMEEYEDDNLGMVSHQALRFIAGKANYVFCSGANGVIQSNARSIHNSDPVDSKNDGNGRKEDAVFPKIELTSTSNDECFKPTDVDPEEVDYKGVDEEDFCTIQDTFTDGDGPKSRTVKGVDYECRMATDKVELKDYMSTEKKYYVPMPVPKCSTVDPIEIDPRSDSPSSWEWGWDNVKEYTDWRGSEFELTWDEDVEGKKTVRIVTVENFESGSERHYSTLTIDPSYTEENGEIVSNRMGESDKVSLEEDGLRLNLAVESDTTFDYQEEVTVTYKRMKGSGRQARIKDETLEGRLAYIEISKEGSYGSSALNSATLKYIPDVGGAC